MKLIGNSVAVPVVKMLAKAIVNTGIFEGQEKITVRKKLKTIQSDLPSLFKDYGENPVTKNFIVHDNSNINYSKVNQKQEESEGNIF